MELHASQQAGQIEADHVYTKVRMPGRWRRRKVCQLCGQPAPCAPRQRADDLRAGRVDASGRPL